MSRPISDEERAAARKRWALILAGKRPPEDKRRSRLEKRRYLPPRLRARVIARDGLVCGICRLEVAMDDVHLDHVKPFSRGGRTTFANLRVTHSFCNMSRGPGCE